ncbi:cytochrome P450 [Azorhizophilus paspali]|uniref:Cytochrome P450 n=1 Tax=Azorhizophilus paspali TaxID=69963 RepID=A0ABV6SU98_AZOPA
MPNMGVVRAGSASLLSLLTVRGRARAEDFEWRGYAFPASRRVMLDLYGTDHDVRLWQAPETFRPERFGSRECGPCDFIPQGKGEHESNRRCPGEQIVIEVMKLGAKVLARQFSYVVPTQNLEIDFRDARHCRKAGSSSAMSMGLPETASCPVRRHGLGHSYAITSGRHRGAHRPRRRIETRRAFPVLRPPLPKSNLHVRLSTRVSHRPVCLSRRSGPDRYFFFGARPAGAYPSARA